MTVDAEFWPDILMLLPVLALLLIGNIFIDRGRRQEDEKGRGFYAGFVAPLIVAFLVLLAAWQVWEAWWR